MKVLRQERRFYWHAYYRDVYEGRKIWRGVGGGRWSETMAGAKKELARFLSEQTPEDRKEFKRFRITEELEILKEHRV